MSCADECRCSAGSIGIGVGIGIEGNIDLLLAPSEENVQRLRQALRRLWADAAIEEITAADLAGEYAVVRYGTPDGFNVDIVSRIGEAFRFEDIESQSLC